MRSVDVRIVFDRDLTELQAERLGRSYAKAIKQLVVAHRLPPVAVIDVDGTAVRVQTVQATPREGKRP